MNERDNTSSKSGPASNQPKRKEKRTEPRSLGREATISMAKKVAEEVKAMKGPLYYAGIGSRETPEEVLRVMTTIAEILAGHGFILRSGGAEGADTAFASAAGARELQEIFRPEQATGAALVEAQKHHPAWHSCNFYTRKLHARNCMIVLGSKLNMPVRAVICWTKNGKLVGGTAQAIRTADYYQIPVINLATWKPGTFRGSSQ